MAPTLGKITAIVAQAGTRGPFRRDVSVLWDWEAHDVAMCLGLVPGEPRSVSARRSDHQSLPEGSGESVEIALELANGARAELELSNLRADPCRRFEVTCERGVRHDLSSLRLGVDVVATLERAERALETGSTH